MVGNLIQTAQWLGRVEMMAFQCFQAAQESPGLGSSLGEFLRDCAEEEAWHLNAIKKAGRLLEGGENIASDLEIDLRTRDRVEGPFQRILNRTGEAPLSEREVLECIVTTEFSEWNPIFIYFMACLKKIYGESLYPSVRINSYLQRIIDYLELTGFEHPKLRRLKALPLIWEESVLVVDDEALIRELASGVLKTEGRVDLARDGREALGLLKGHYYKAIVTDLEMPHLDGLGFFRLAREIHPRIAPRFIFLSAGVDRLDPNEPGLKEATRLRKPFRAWELIEEVKARLGGS